MVAKSGHKGCKQQLPSHFEWRAGILDFNKGDTELHIGVSTHAQSLILCKVGVLGWSPCLALATRYPTKTFQQRLTSERAQNQKKVPDLDSVCFN
jgi:hypothetical protein